MNKSDSESKVKLEACWTCGGEAKISASKGGVKLIVCTVEGCHFNTFAMDLKIWQSRPLEQQLKSENDDLKEGFAESRRKLFALGKNTREAYALLQGENDELRKQGEGMRCCPNCKHDDDRTGRGCHGCQDYGNWQPKTNESGD